MHNKNVFFNHPSDRLTSDAEDKLGYKDYAEAIFQQIRRTNIENTGITFGILGEWGMGKTTVMNLLEGRMEQLDSFIVIRFDAWQYLHQEELWLALVRKIIRQIYSGASWFQFRWRMFIWRVKNNPQLFDVVLGYLTKALALFSLIILSILSWGVLFENENYLKLFEIQSISIAGITFGAVSRGVLIYSSILIISIFLYLAKEILFGNLKTNLPAISKEGFDKNQFISIDDFKDEFHAILRSLGKEKTVVVLIDDLDRCPPNQIVPVMESIKHLGLEDNRYKDKSEIAKIVFVLALDPTAVEQALSGYFKEYILGPDKEKEIYEFTKNYIGKIVQVPLLLPPLTELQLEKMLSEIMATHQGDTT